MFKLKCKIPFAIISFAVFVGFVSCNEKFFHKSRMKRTLVYPNPSKVQYIMGAGMPLDLEDEAVAVGHILKASFIMPTNASDYTRPSIVTLRKRRSLLRWDIYDMLSKAADLHDLGGKPCILRTVCEIADAPIDKSTGLLGELLHVLFTPTTTTDEVRNHSDNEYYAAYHMGKEVYGRCKYIFPECKVNFVDLFSKYV